ncbi:hypothetical protein HaLaN_02096 [Haematococcus lacustris]|uniref:Uncharacterized protein n=1 Tax=Haematococcus lacustris TaxID=44745 RepID=A0A699YB80_HAELA|nr:hypothetical protein HaLaN_02096 [Haematococcus lacustris]
MSCTVCALCAMHLEEEAAIESQKQWGTRKQLVVFFGNAGIGTRGSAQLCTAPSPVRRSWTAASPPGLKAGSPQQVATPSKASRQAQGVPSVGLQEAARLSPQGPSPAARSTVARVHHAMLSLLLTSEHVFHANIGRLTLAREEG